MIELIGEMISYIRNNTKTMKREELSKRRKRRKNKVDFKEGERKRIKK